jgi:hydroxymethylbilane synthase (EC 2.5.1.61)
LRELLSCGHFLARFLCLEMPMSREIRIATRQSALALWQAEYVKARLEQAHPA